jgi:hypothetical protein
MTTRGLAVLFGHGSFDVGCRNRRRRFARRRRQSGYQSASESSTSRSAVVTSTNTYSSEPSCSTIERREPRLLELTCPP